VWKKNSDEPGVHETFHAYSYEEVEAMLEEKYGKEIIVSLTDVEAAARPR
jgi:ABC-type metal ion transport system substrate-binding protein